jgi:hypothetical protein
MANRFAKYGPSVPDIAPTAANRFSRFGEAAGTSGFADEAPNVGGRSPDASPLDYARDSMNVSKAFNVEQPKPMPLGPMPSMGQMLLEGERNNLLAARQRTDPSVYDGTRPLRKKLGVLIPQNSDFGPVPPNTFVNFDDSTAKTAQVDPKKHVVLIDPVNGQPTVYERNKDATGTDDTEEPLWKSLGRVILPGFVSGPVVGPPRAVGAANAASQATRAATAAEKAAAATDDLMSFERAQVPVFAPSFGGPATQATAKGLSDTFAVGAPLQNALEETYRGTQAATQRLAGQFGEARTGTDAGRAVAGAIERGLSGTRDAVATLADELSPTADYNGAGRAVQQGADRARSARLDDLEPGVVEALGIPARAPIPRNNLPMSEGTARRANEAAPIRETIGREFTRTDPNTGQPYTFRSVPTQTSRGTEVPSALPRELTLTQRTTPEMLDNAQLDRLIRAPAAQTSFAARSEGLYERSWRMMPAIMRENNTADPLMLPAHNTRQALGQIDRSIANQIAGQGTIDGALSERIRNPRAGNFTMADLRAIRTEVGRAIGNLNPLNATLDGAQLRNLYSSITRDMEIGFEDVANRALIGTRRSNNRANHVTEEVARRAAGALRAFRTADRYYRAGQTRFERFHRLLNAETPEAAARSIVNAARGRGSGNLDLIRTAMGSLRPDERFDISALILRELGVPPTTARGITQTVGFDAMEMLRNWREISPAARELLFTPQQVARVETVIEEAQNWDRVRRIVGAESPEAIFAEINRAALSGTKGDIDKLKAIHSVLSPSERGELAAGIISEMGRPAGSARGLVQDLGFSVESFMTRWNNMTPDARVLLFGRDHIRALNDVVAVARRLANVEGFANRSNTYRSGGNVLGIAATAGTAVAGGPAGLAYLAGALGGSYGLAVLFSRPAYAKWLSRYLVLKAQAVQTGAAGGRLAARHPALVSHIARLGLAAQREPELVPIYRSLAAENGVIEGSGSDGQPHDMSGEQQSKEGPDDQSSVEPHDDPDSTNPRFEPPMRLGGPRPADAFSPNAPTPQTARPQAEMRSYNPSPSEDAAYYARRGAEAVGMPPSQAERFGKGIGGAVNMATPADDVSDAVETGSAASAATAALNFLPGFRGGKKAAEAALDLARKELAEVEAQAVRLFGERNTGRIMGPNPVPDVPGREIPADVLLESTRSQKAKLEKAIAEKRDELGAKAPTGPHTSVPVTTSRDQREIEKYVDENPYVQAVPGRQGFPKKSEQKSLVKKFFEEGGELPAQPWGRDMPSAAKAAMAKAFKSKTQGEQKELVEASKGELLESARAVSKLKGEIEKAGGTEVTALQQQLAAAQKELAEARGRAKAFETMYNNLLNKTEKKG